MRRSSSPHFFQVALDGRIYPLRQSQAQMMEVCMPKKATIAKKQDSALRINALDAAPARMTALTFGDSHELNGSLSSPKLEHVKS
jgi:hypothetical protein